jgi:hypothetical protein
MSVEVSAPIVGVMNETDFVLAPAKNGVLTPLMIDHL